LSAAHTPPPACLLTLEWEEKAARSMMSSEFMRDAKDQRPERAKRRVGRTIKGRWRLDGLIGLGVTSAVYSATHRIGTRVALKMLDPEPSLDSGEIKTRFLREAYLANLVDHPAVVRVLDDEVDEEGSIFMVMELLDGETLADRLERNARALTVEEILLVADRVLDVLAAAHDKHIVHQDVEPGNVFFTRAGGVRLLDFGFARYRPIGGPPRLPTGRSVSTPPRLDSTIGTPAYLAPEQARRSGSDVDERTDLWAVGAVMFRLLTGRVVHTAESVSAQLLATRTRRPPRIGTLAPAIPACVAAVVDKALAFNKHDRWSDATSMQRAIRDAYREIAPAVDEAGRGFTKPLSLFDEAPHSSDVVKAPDEDRNAVTVRELPERSGISLTPVENHRVRLRRLASMGGRIVLLAAVVLALWALVTLVGLPRLKH